MSSNVLVFAWNRPLPGRENLSAQHFQDFSEYLGAEQRRGTIESFEPVFLDPHGGTLNGFFLIRGEPRKLAELASSDEWQKHITRGLFHLDGSCVVRGVSGQLLMDRMALWTSLIPKA